jgi:hypothetical protein
MENSLIYKTKSSHFIVFFFLIMFFVPIYFIIYGFYISAIFFSIFNILFIYFQLYISATIYFYKNYLTIFYPFRIRNRKKNIEYSDIIRIKHKDFWIKDTGDTILRYQIKKKWKKSYILTNTMGSVENGNLEIIYKEINLYKEISEIF